MNIAVYSPNIDIVGKIQTQKFDEVKDYYQSRQAELIGQWKEKNYTGVRKNCEHCEENLAKLENTVILNPTLYSVFMMGKLAGAVECLKVLNQEKESEMETFEEMEKLWENTFVIQRIISMLFQYGDMTAPMIADEMDAAEDEIIGILETAAEVGYVAKTNVGKTVYYQLTGPGILYAEAIRDVPLEAGEKKAG